MRLRSAEQVAANGSDSRLEQSQWCKHGYLRPQRFLPRGFAGLRARLRGMSLAGIGGVLSSALMTASNSALGTLGIAATKPL